MLYFIGFETNNFYIFFIKMIVILNHSYSFKNKEPPTVTKNGDTVAQQCFVKLKISKQMSKPFWYWHSSNTTV